MSTTTIYDYSTEADYNFNSTDIELVAGEAKLKLQDLPGQTFSEDFSSDVGFTVPATAEFSGGTLRQIDFLEGASLGVPFTVDADATSGDGTLTGTLNNGATVSDGQLDLSGGLTKYASYVATGKINAMEGAVEFDWIPQFSGNPASDVIIFRFADSLGSNNNDLYVRMDTAKAFRLVSKTSASAALQTNNPFGSLTVTAGVTYRVSYTWNFRAGLGEHELRINGVQQGGTLTTETALRSDDLTTVTYIALGDAAYSDSKYDNFKAFPSAKFTDDYTPIASIPEYRYQESYILSPVEDFSGSPDGFLQSVESFSVTISHTVQFTFNSVNGDAYWYDSGWKISDKTFTESNTAEVLTANMPTFPFPESTTQFRYGVVFHDCNDSQASVTEIGMEYTHQTYSALDDVISPINANRFYAEGFTSFTESITTPANTAVQYVMIVDGSDTYWDGAAWSASNATFAQSNTAADINTNIATLTTTRKEIGFHAMLRSTDGLLTPKIDTNTFVYNAALPDATRARCVDVNGYVDLTCAAESGVVIQVRAYKRGFTNVGVYQRRAWQTKATTLSDGYFSFGLPLQKTGTYWEIKIGKDKHYFALPDQDAIDFSTLTLLEAEE